MNIDNIQLEIANIRGQAMNTLLNLGGQQEEAADFAGVLAAQLSPDGHNTSLSDPESAFGMMSQINQHEVDFKAQFAELEAMRAAVETMEDVGSALSSIDTSTANAAIVAQLQGFVADYNAWEDRFDDTVADGGVLDNVQAAEISLYELEQSIRSIFNGANEGVSGLADLGITIDPVTQQASLDVGKFEAVLASNKQGAVSAIDEFSANFAKSADLLSDDDNFIARAMDNRSRAIDFIADNRNSLQAEFGTGEAYQASGETARALAAYETATAI